MKSKLLVTSSTGLTTRVIPLEPLHESVARYDYAYGNARDLVSEGPNFALLETSGATVWRKLGPASLTQDPPYHNGVKLNPDLRLLRALAVECVSTAPSDPKRWTGEAEFAATLGYIADAGQPNANQTAAAALLTAWAPDAVLSVGDFTYNAAASGGAGLNADTAVFNAFIAAQKLWVAMGNHEWDVAGIMALLAAKFPYLTSFAAGTSYYDQLITDGDGVKLAHVVMLDGGKTSDWTDIGAGLTGGIHPGSTQWNWMLGRINTHYDAQWRIACVHWPCTTGVAENTIMEEVAALARSGHFDLILTGHTHGNEEEWIHGVPVLNISTASRALRRSTDTLRGALADARIEWRDNSRHCITRLNLTGRALTWEVYDLADSAAPIRTRSIAPRPPAPLGALRVQMLNGPGITKWDCDLAAGDSQRCLWPQGMPFTHAAALLQISGSLATPFVPRHTRCQAVAVGF
jgi:hypothetical protein